MSSALPPSPNGTHPSNFLFGVNLDLDKYVVTFNTAKSDADFLAAMGIVPIWDEKMKTYVLHRTVASLAAESGLLCINSYLIDVMNKSGVPVKNVSSYLSADQYKVFQRGEDLTCDSLVADMQKEGFYPAGLVHLLCHEILFKSETRFIGVVYPVPELGLFPYRKGGIPGKEMGLMDLSNIPLDDHPPLVLGIRNR